MPTCDRCHTEPVPAYSTPEMDVKSCKCGAWKILRTIDPTDKIREALEVAEAKQPGGSFVASLRQQFQDRGTLSTAQIDALNRIVGA